MKPCKILGQIQSGRQQLQRLEHAKTHVAVLVDKLQQQNARQREILGQKMGEQLPVNFAALGPQVSADVSGDISNTAGAHQQTQGHPRAPGIEELHGQVLPGLLHHVARRPTTNGYLTRHKEGLVLRLAWATRGGHRDILRVLPKSTQHLPDPHVLAPRLREPRGPGPLLVRRLGALQQDAHHVPSSQGCSCEQGSLPHKIGLNWAQAGA
mmetsp:Transcript_67829/g.155609  ORF Transcript_67829/g.155609 Transcript_67829/m.155609 type:complete len:210 (-) Transcript_67829:351-980(-)